MGHNRIDYDNDGDYDINYVGGIEPLTLVDTSNPGTMLQNHRCSAVFSYDDIALANAANHTLRNDQGSASGDLNNDGFVDIVSVSNFDIPADLPNVPTPLSYTSPFDSVAGFVPTWSPVINNSEITEFIWNGFTFPDGTLSVEINNAENRNHWVAVNVTGSVGHTPLGAVNRDGIGAVVQFTPKRGHTSMQPIVAGASYLSQDSLTANFGMGHKRKGDIDVLWPGGVRNRLYDVHKRETINFPEIPCSFDANWDHYRNYKSCVRNALRDLRHAQVISKRESRRLRKSAQRAYFDHRNYR